MGVRILVVTQAQMSELFRRTDGQWTNMPPDVLVQDVRRDWNTGNFEVKVWSMEFPEVDGEGAVYQRVVLEVTKAEPKQELEKKVEEVLEQMRKMRPWWEIPPVTTGYPGGVSMGTLQTFGRMDGPGWDPAPTKK